MYTYLLACLRIVTEKKHPQMGIWTFEWLVHQINSLCEVLKLKQFFWKNKVVTGKTPFFVIGPFYTPYSIPANTRLGEDVLNTSWRRLHCNIFCLLRRLQGIIARCLLEDVLKKKSCKHVLKTFLEDVLEICHQDFFKTSWKTKDCYAADVLENKKCLLGFVLTLASDRVVFYGNTAFSNLNNLKHEISNWV